MHPLLADPWVAARIDAAVSPYRALLSKDDLAFLREELAERLSSDERAALELRRARPRHVEQSGEAFVGKLEEEHAVTQKRVSGAGG
jgi:hypothetical protein